jgi:hypothetical protein
MGKFDQQLTHWRDQHRIAVEDLQDLQAGKRKIAEDTGRAGSMSPTVGQREFGMKLSSLHS